MTLIEIIVSVAILAIIVLGTLAMFTSGFKMITISNWHNKMTFNSQTEAEQNLYDKNTSASTFRIDFETGSPVFSPGAVLHSVQSVPEVPSATADVYYFQPKN